MRYAVISDVHANVDALDAVLGDIDKRNIGDIIFLGDAVGYGPNPNESIERIHERCKFSVAGNHDWGSLGLTDIGYFNAHARVSIEWTIGVLANENKKMLGSLPLKRELRGGNMLLVHSTPKEPAEWHYLLTLWDAELNFQYFDRRVCLLGHSHQPFIIERVPSGDLITYKDSMKMKNSGRYIINAGSVGQPRDGDPRACYVVIDDENVEIVRIPYDIARVQNKMRKEHLPEPLIERLAAGR